MACVPPTAPAVSALPLHGLGRLVYAVGALCAGRCGQAVLHAPRSPPLPCSGSLVGDYGARVVFGLTATFPLLVTGAALAIPEERVRSPGVMAGSGRPRATARGASPAPTEGVVAAFKQQAALLWATGKQPAILLPAVFVFLWQVRPPGALLSWRR